VPRTRRVITAKRAFTAWAVVVFGFLYLPIAVMVLFAFNKPSAAALEGFTGSNVCDLPPSQVGNVTVWNGFTTCWFDAGLHDPTYIPAILTSAKIAAAAAIVSTLLGLAAALALARIEQVPAGAVRLAGLSDPGRPGDRDRGGFADLLRPDPELRPVLPAAGCLDDLLRAGGVRCVAGDAGHQSALRRHGRLPGGGWLRPRLGPDRDVPADHAATPVPGDQSPRRCCRSRSPSTTTCCPAFTNGTTNTWPIVLYSAVASASPRPSTPWRR
jgi:hypothetical protein